MHIETCPSCGQASLQIAGHCFSCALRDREPDLPSHIGPYPILREIGSGGMGTVYGGMQHCPLREVAIKVMRDGVLAEPELRAKFLAEREIAGRFEHPNIIRVYAAGEDADDNPYYVMELAQRGTLAELLRSPAAQRPSHDEALRMVSEIALAADYAHSLGVLHRDLKPANILIGADMRPRVTDFGVAKLLERSAETSDRISQADTVVGSWAYMAPEQAGFRATAGTAGVASDVYGLGAILYELLCGQAPYAVRTREELLTALAQGPVPALRERDPSIRYDVEAVVLKALEHAPERRYRSAGELAEDLRRALTRREPVARARTRRGRIVSALARHGPGLSLWLGLWLFVVGSLLSLNQLMLQASVKHNQSLKQQTTQVASSLQRVFRALAAQTAELASDPLAQSAFEVGVTPAVDDWLVDLVADNPLWSGAQLITLDGQLRARAPADGPALVGVDPQQGLAFPDEPRVSDLEDAEDVHVSPLFRAPDKPEQLQLALYTPVYAEPGHLARGLAVTTISLEALARELDYPPLVLLAPRQHHAASAAVSRRAVDLVEVSFDRRGKPSVARTGDSPRTVFIAKVAETGFAVVAHLEEPPLLATAFGTWLWVLATTIVCAAAFVLTRRSQYTQAT